MARAVVGVSVAVLLAALYVTAAGTATLLEFFSVIVAALTVAGLSASLNVTVMAAVVATLVAPLLA